MSDTTMSDDSEDEYHMHAADMNDGMVALFKSFMLREDYEGAIEFVSDCFGFVPTQYVINEIIFKIMMNCDKNLAYEALDYLEGRLRVMSSQDDQKSNFIKALNDQSSTYKDIWNAFSHFVWSSLYHLKIPEAYHSHRESIKHPNCDILVEIYVKAFLKCSIKSVILGSRKEERFSGLLKWISLYYKNNLLTESVLGYLHNLLDYIVDSEISNDPSLPSCVKIHTANLSQYMFLILSNCKDVFATTDKQQSFFNYSMSPYLITKVCQYRLHELIDKSSHQNPGMLTLKSIVDNYFFYHPEKKRKNTKQKSSSLSKKSNSPRRLNRGKKLKKFSKDPIPGDTDFHERCRLGRPADLLCALYADKNKDINEKNSAGNTPLHEACLASSYLCCKFLIEEAGDRKVDYKATENEGRTPLHCAVYVDAFDVVKLLLNRGGNDLIMCEDNWGRKPIDYSTSKEMQKILKEIESKVKGNDKEESQGSSDSIQPKLPIFRNPEDFHLYLRTLRTLVSNYCEIYDLPKNESDVKVLSHASKECYHFKAESKTLCSKDSATLDTFGEVIKKFISCAELVSKEENATKELFHWNTYATVFK